MSDKPTSGPIAATGPAADSQPARPDQAAPAPETLPRAANGYQQLEYSKAGIYLWGTVTAMGVLLGIFAVDLWEHDKVRDLYGSIIRTHEARLQTARIASFLREAQWRCSEGITESQEDLKACTEISYQLRVDAKALQDSLASSPRHQQELLDGLERSLHDWLEEARRRNDGLASQAESDEAAPDGLERLQSVLALLEAEENQLLGAQNRDLEETSYLASVAEGVLALALIGIFVFVIRQMNRSLSLSRRALAVLRNSNQELEEAVAHRTVELSRSQQNLVRAQRIAELGSFEWNLQDGTMSWSDELYRIFGAARPDYLPTEQSMMDRVHSDDRERVEEAVRQALEEDKTYQIDYRICLPDGGEEIVSAQGQVDRDAAGVPVLFSGTIQKVTAWKKAQEELRRSNQELSQFAYIASHDLQEPLRMVSSYLGLLSKRYSGRFDKEADEFIEFAVDGAARMKVLINSLLEYSRVSNAELKLRPVQLQETVDRVLQFMRLRIEETGAAVSSQSLPVVSGDESQLTRLFQNLLENALKFRSQDSPRIQISAQRLQDRWQISVADNGLGIKDEFKERVFEIFKRLNSRADYPGTGIGLALCKRIVERHHSKIWVEPASGGGSIFQFTLPVSEVT